jgi:hypothetical protein
MMYKAKVAVRFDSHTKHSTQSEHHVQFLNVKTRRYEKKPLSFKRLSLTFILLMCTFGRAPNNASKWEMGFNSVA